jgi:hypothetical protein
MLAGNVPLRIPKVVPAFEKDVLMHQVRILLQVSAQGLYVARVQEVHGPTKCYFFDPLTIRQIQVIGHRRFFNAPFQPGPARKPVLASDCELCVAEP